MRYLFVDTSFLLSSIELGKDLISLGEDFVQESLIPATSKQVIEELNILSSRYETRKLELAKKIISKFKSFETNSKNADESLIELCIKNNGILATADLELLNKALDKGISVLFLKSNKKLAYFES